MIKRAEEMVREIKEQMRGGQGSVVINHIFKQDEINGRARLIARIELEPNCSIGAHIHENEEEIFYIIDGIAVVEDHGVAQTLKAGDASITKGGEGHSLRNGGDTNLSVMAVILLY
jgi:mannose-6-phosphate isomerase-like protein (cupin superfamily)